jgi:hypothetical protein
MSALTALARAVVAPPLAPGLYLYTTPPKAVLKDPAATLFQLRLFPAAHVHVGSSDAAKAGASAQEGAWLRPEAAALMSDSVPKALEARAAAAEGGAAAAGGGGDAAAAERERERVLANARRAAAAAGGSGVAGDGEKKVPKWLKR